MFKWVVIVKSAPDRWLAQGMFDAKYLAEAWAKENYHPDTIWHVAAYIRID